MSILEAFLAGKEARRVADAQEQINAMQSFIGQNGQAIMAGDQNALGQLAGFGAEGLGMAMNVQSNVEARADRAYNRTRQEKADARGDQEWEMRLEEYKAGKTAAELAAEAARIEEAVKVGLAAKTPEEFDALMIQMGAPELAGQFASREALAMKGMSMAEAFKAAGPQDPTEGAPTGYKWTDPANPGAGVTPLPGYTAKSPVEINMGADAGEYLYGADAGVPAGWRVHKGTGVASPIPGGPAAVEAQGVADAEAQAAGNASIASDTIVTATKRALEASGEQMFGAPGTSVVAALPIVGPASPSGEKMRQNEVLKAQAIVSNLQAMRDASPTGGALGAVTKPELDMLAAKSGALDPNSPNYDRDVLDYTRTLLRVVHGQAAGDAIFAQEFGEVAPPPVATPRGPVIVDGFQIEAIE